MFSEHAHERAVEPTDVLPAAGADGDERQTRVASAKLRDRVADGAKVLARLERADREHVRRPHTGALDRRGELLRVARHRRVDPELRDLQPVRREALSLELPASEHVGDVGLV